MASSRSITDAAELPTLAAHTPSPEQSAYLIVNSGNQVVVTDGASLPDDREHARGFPRHLAVIADAEPADK